MSANLLAHSSGVSPHVGVGAQSLLYLGGSVRERVGRVVRQVELERFEIHLHFICISRPYQEGSDCGLPAQPCQGYGGWAMPEPPFRFASFYIC